MRYYSYQLRAIALLTTVVLTGCQNSDDSPNVGAVTDHSLLGVLRSRGLTTMADAVVAAGLGGTLGGPGSMTLLAPTNEAFAAVEPSELQRLLDPANVGELRALLEYHLVDGARDAAFLAGITSVMSVEGSDLLIDLPGDVLFINEGRVGVTDVAATNGILHEVDAVLRPPVSLLETLEARGFTILRDLIDRADLAGTLTGGNLTLIAPTDAAFLALPAGRLDELRDPANQAELIDLLTFHLLAGRRLALELILAGDSQNLDGDLLFTWVDDYRVVVNGGVCRSFNVPATDGLLHLSDGVLIPTVPLRQLMAELGLNTLGALVDVAGLDAPLTAPGTFTLIAPSDAALAALPAGELTALLDPINQAQRLDFLQRHLLLDALQEVEIARRDALVMVNGQLFLIDSSSTLTVDGIPFAVSNRFASNGALHVVEVVLPGL